MEGLHWWACRPCSYHSAQTSLHWASWWIRAPPAASTSPCCTHSRRLARPSPCSPAGYTSGALELVTRAPACGSKAEPFDFALLTLLGASRSISRTLSQCYARSQWLALASSILARTGWGLCKGQVFSLFTPLASKLPLHCLPVSDCLSRWAVDRHLSQTFWTPFDSVAFRSLLLLSSSRSCW